MPDQVIVVTSPPNTVIVAEPEGPQGSPGPAGPPGSSAAFSGTAGMNLSGHRVVTTDSSGHLIHADPAVGEPLMLTLGAALTGQTVQAIAEGPVTEPSWSWTLDVPIWLAPGGVLTQVLPMSGVLVQVAQPMTATQILFRPMPPLVLA